MLSSETAWTLSYWVEKGHSAFCHLLLMGYVLSVDKVGVRTEGNFRPVNFREKFLIAVSCLSIITQCNCRLSLKYAALNFTVLQSSFGSGSHRWYPVVSNINTSHHMDGTYIPGKTGSFTSVFLFWEMIQKQSDWFWLCVADCTWACSSLLASRKLG